MKNLNQFIKFEPILKEKIWGGQKLINIFNKKSDKNNIGESWEISDVDKDVSIVSEGNLKGKNLRDLIAEYKADLVGEKVYNYFGDNFPLLIKFIDAKENLSLQVHPNDLIAQRRHKSLGKTEMWYVLDADKGSEIFIGFSEEIDKKTFSELLTEGRELDFVNTDFVKHGDAYLVPAGRIHAIGEGVLLAEIQETSDITYRVFDWNRKEGSGSSRKLHIDLALDAIDYSAKSNYKEGYDKKKNVPTRIVKCKYFTTNFLHLTSNYKANHKNKDSFIIYMCVGGKAVFSVDSKKELLKTGETLLVPATLKKFKIHPKEKVELLEVYIQ